MSTRTGDEPAFDEPAFDRPVSEELGSEAPVLDEPVFIEYRPHRRRFLVVGAVLGVILLLFTVVYALRLTVYSPSAVVHAYFQALSDRDLVAALRTTDPAATGGLPDDLLQPAVLESEAYTPPSQLEIGQITVDGRRAEVRVEFTIGDQPATARLQLRRADGFADRLLHRWRIVDGVRPLPLATAPATVEVNGVRVVAQDLDGPRTLPVVFGGYRVGVPADDPLWDAQEVTVLVGSDRAPMVDVPMAPDPQVRAEVERQVAELLDQCAASTELLPPGCPFGNARYGRASNVAWRISSYPDLALMPSPDGFGGVAMVVRSTIDGEAVVTGTREVFGQEVPFEIVVPFPVSGVVTVDGTEITFQPGW